MEIYFNLFCQLKLINLGYKTENLSIFGFFVDIFLFFDVIRQNTTIYSASIWVLKGGKEVDYEINDETLAVIPTEKGKCEAIELHGNIPIKDTSLTVIEHSCEYFGINYKTRLNSTYKFIKARYKAPVVVEESSRIIFFPISSPRNKDTVWMSYNNILAYEKSDEKNETIVKFNNGYSMNVPVSYYTFNSQYSKAARLHASYSVRNGKKR